MIPSRTPERSREALALASLPWPGSPQAPATPSIEPASSPLFDLGAVRDLVRFGWSALQRHRTLALGLVMGSFAASALAAIVLPRSYEAQTIIVAQKNMIMPALDNPRRPVPADADAPTRLAQESVMSHDNLVEIVRDAHLLESWNAVRSPLGRVKEWLGWTLFHQRLSEQEKIDGLVETLKMRMWVSVSEGTITIGVSWPSARDAARIVDVAQQSFLDHRHATEVALIGESIAILERHVAQAHDEIESAMSDLPGPAVRLEKAAIPGRAPVMDPRRQAEIAGLQATLAARRAAISDMESARTQRLAALQLQLAELRRKFGSAHPDIIATQQSIDALAVESPQLATLRADAATIQKQLAALGASDVGGGAASGIEPALARAALERVAREGTDSIEAPRVTYARSRLKIAIADYEDMLDRLRGANIELETARAAFKYRYSVMTPPTIPKHPAKPKVALLLIGGLVLGVALAAVLPAMLDLLSGRLFESWQVERRVGLRVLGELHLPA